MLTTPSIREIASGRPGLHAFRIDGEVSRDDMTAMGARMRDVFAATEDKVDMLLIFDRYEGSETFAGFSWPALASRIESLWQVERYVTAKAPAPAAAMIETMGKIMPVEAQAFDTEEEAWAFLGTVPPRT